MEHQSTVNQSTAMADNVLRQHSCGLLGNHYWQQLGSNPVIVRTLKLLHWRQGSTFEGTCQEGQVNLYSYLPDTILTSPAKGVIEWTWKWPFCMYYTCTNQMFSCYSFIWTVKIYWISIAFPLCFSISEVTWWNLTCHVGQVHSDFYLPFSHFEKNYQPGAGDFPGIPRSFLG